MTVDVVDVERLPVTVTPVDVLVEVVPGELDVTAPVEPTDRA